MIRRKLLEYPQHTPGDEDAEREPDPGDVQTFSPSKGKYSNGNDGETNARNLRPRQPLTEKDNRENDGYQWKERCDYGHDRRIGRAVIGAE